MCRIKARFIWDQTVFSSASMVQRRYCYNGFVFFTTEGTLNQCRRDKGAVKYGTFQNTNKKFCKE